MYLVVVGCIWRGHLHIGERMEVDKVLEYEEASWR